MIREYESFFLVNLYDTVQDIVKFVAYNITTTNYSNCRDERYTNQDYL